MHNYTPCSRLGIPKIVQVYAHAHIINTHQPTHAHDIVGKERLSLHRENTNCTKDAIKEGKQCETKSKDTTRFCNSRYGCKSRQRQTFCTVAANRGKICVFRMRNRSNSFWCAKFATLLLIPYHGSTPRDSKDNSPWHCNDPFVRNFTARQSLCLYHQVPSHAHGILVALVSDTVQSALPTNNTLNKSHGHPNVYSFCVACSPPSPMLVDFRNCGSEPTQSGFRTTST